MQLRSTTNSFLMISRLLVIGSILFTAYAGFEVIHARWLPRLEVAPVIDFGTRKTGEIVDVPVTVTNTGGGSLRVYSLKATCGCATVDCGSMDQPIAPGTSAEALVKIKGDRKKGKLGVDILVNSNDPAIPNRAIRITGQFAP